MQTALVDTSGWVHLIRAKGDFTIKDAISDLMIDGQAFWCPVIRVELWRGTSSAHDAKALSALELVVPSLPLNDAVWDLAYHLGHTHCKKGRFFPTPDVIIFACATVHGVDVLHHDRHFDEMKKLAEGGL